MKSRWLRHESTFRMCLSHLTHWAPSTLMCIRREKPGPLQNLTLITCQKNSTILKFSNCREAREKALDERKTGVPLFVPPSTLLLGIHSTFSPLPAAFKSSGFLKTHSWMPIPSQAFWVHPCVWPRNVAFFCTRATKWTIREGAAEVCSLPSAVHNAQQTPSYPAMWHIIITILPTSMNCNRNINSYESAQLTTFSKIDGES